MNQELINRQQQFNNSLAIIEAIHHPVVVIDKEFFIKNTNTAFLTKFNATKSQTEGKSLFTIGVHRWDNPLLRSMLQNSIPQKSAIIDFEMAVNVSGLGECIVRLNCRPIISDEEELILIIIEDITEKRIAQKRLIESEAKFRNLILQAPVLITTFRGPSFIVETINKAALEVWGKSYDEVINKPLFETSPELEVGLKKILDDIYTTGDSFKAPEIKVQLKRTGKPDTAYFNSIYQPMHDADNKINGIILIGTEVTEQVTAVQNIKISEQRYGAAVEAVQGILWTNTADGQMDGEQKGWAALTGQTYEEYKGYGWATAVHPDDAQPTIDVWNEAVKQRKTFVFEHRVKTRGGKWELFSIRAIPLLNEDGTIREWVGVHTNITEQRNSEEKIKASEKRFRTLAKNSPDMIVQLDKNFRYTYVSPILEKMMGKTEEEFIGRTFREMGFPENMCMFFDEQLAIATTKKQHTVEYTGFSGEDAFTRILTDTNEKGDVNSFLIITTDVTAIKKDERVLQKLTSHLKLATDSANVGTWSLDLQTQKLEWSALHKKLWGYDEHRQDLEYEDWHKVILPEDKENVLAKIEEAKINRSFYQVEYRIKRANDSVIRWMKSTGQYQYNDNVEATALSGVSIDITEQVEIRKGIEESEAKFRTLSETIPNMIWTATADGKKDFFNKYFIDYTGYSLNELKDDGWLKIISSIDMKKELDQWQESLKTGTEFKIENRIRRHDGIFLWHLSHGIAQKDIEGNIIGWIGTDTDINEQKVAKDKITESEERFRILADNIPNLAWMAEADGNIFWYNKKWYDYTGTTLADMEGWGWQSVHNQEELPKVLVKWKSSIETGKPFEMTFPIKGTDGKFRPFLTRAIPLYNSENEIYRWLGTNTDVSKVEAE